MAVTIKAMTMKSRTEEMMSCHVLAGVSAKAGPFPVMWLALLSRQLWLFGPVNHDLRRVAYTGIYRVLCRIDRGYRGLSSFWMT